MKDSKRSFFNQMDNETQEDYIKFLLETLKKEHEELKKVHKRAMEDRKNIKEIINKTDSTEDKIKQLKNYMIKNE